MGKKNRVKKRTVFASIEGENTEIGFFKLLKELYFDQSTTSLREKPVGGGNPDHIIGFAFKECSRTNSFAWIDEDTDIKKDTRERLFKEWRVDDEKKEDLLNCPLKDLQRRFNPDIRNPILIVSQPVCVESLILRTLGRKPTHSTFDEKTRKKQVDDLKSSLAGLTERMPLYDYLKEHLTKDILDQKRIEIPELDLLIKMVSGD